MGAGVVVVMPGVAIIKAKDDGFLFDRLTGSLLKAGVYWHAVKKMKSDRVNKKRFMSLLNEPIFLGTIYPSSIKLMTVSSESEPHQFGLFSVSFQIVARLSNIFNPRNNFTRVITQLSDKGSIN